MVYMLQFEPLGNARHSARYYVGYCADHRLEDRIAEHRAGRGAKITAAAVQRGYTLEVVLTIPGATRQDERRIKNQKNHARFLARHGR